MAERIRKKIRGREGEEYPLGYSAGPCTGDGFLQCSGHIITFTHFCSVSRSTEAKPSWDRQQKSCREVRPEASHLLLKKLH